MDIKNRKHALDEAKRLRDQAEQLLKSADYILNQHPQPGVKAGQIWVNEEGGIMVATVSNHEGAVDLSSINSDYDVKLSVPKSYVFDDSWSLIGELVIPPGEGPLVSIKYY
jgi:hypothetical protein